MEKKSSIIVILLFSAIVLMKTLLGMYSDYVSTNAVLQKQMEYNKELSLQLSLLKGALAGDKSCLKKLGDEMKAEELIKQISITNNLLNEIVGVIGKQDKTADLTHRVVRQLESNEALLKKELCK